MRLLAKFVNLMNIIEQMIDLMRKVIYVSVYLLKSIDHYWSHATTYP